MLQAFVASSTRALFGWLGALQEMAVRHLLARVVYMVLLTALSRNEKEELTQKYPHTSQDMGKSGVPAIAHLHIHLDPQEPAMGSGSCTQIHGRGSESTSCWLDDLKFSLSFGSAASCVLWSLDHGEGHHRQEEKQRGAVHH